jgi:hypothetical protein
MNDPKQVMAALDKANEVRLHLAKIKRALGEGRMTMREALEDPHVQRTRRLGEMLEARPKMGPHRARRFCQQLHYSPDELVGDLSGYQRRRIAALLD